MHPRFFASTSVDQVGAALDQGARRALSAAKYIPGTKYIPGDGHFGGLTFGWDKVAKRELGKLEKLCTFDFSPKPWIASRHALKG